MKLKHDYEDLTGKMLIATPSTEESSYFAKSVIYIAKYDPYDGAVGLIVNQPAPHIPEGVLVAENEFRGGESMSLDFVNPYIGGPIELERGFILHAPYKSDSSNSKKIYLSSNLDLLKQMQKGKEQDNSMFLCGYCGWSEGQLENEIKKNHWFVLSLQQEIIFSNNNDKKWYNALSVLNIDPVKYSYRIGSC